MKTQTSPICWVLRMLTELFLFFLVSGEDLVSEPKDEAETRSPGLSHSPSPAGHFSASASGSVPQHGRTSTPLLSYGPSLLPITCPAAAPPSAHASSLPSSNNDTPPTFLLRNCHFRDFSLPKWAEDVQSSFFFYLCDFKYLCTMKIFFYVIKETSIYF